MCYASKSEGYEVGGEEAPKKKCGWIFFCTED